MKAKTMLQVLEEPWNDNANEIAGTAIVVSIIQKQPHELWGHGHTK